MSLSGSRNRNSNGSNRDGNCNRNGDCNSSVKDVKRDVKRGGPIDRDLNGTDGSDFFQ